MLEYTTSSVMNFPFLDLIIPIYIYVDLSVNFMRGQHFSPCEQNRMVMMHNGEKKVRLFEYWNGIQVEHLNFGH